MEVTLKELATLLLKLIEEGNEERIRNLKTTISLWNGQTH